MLQPLAPAVCTPADFVNPFPALLVPAALCAGLLSFGAAALFLRNRRQRQAEQMGDIHRLYRLVYKTAIGTALWSWLLTGWLWWEAHVFGTWCLLSPNSPRALLFFAEQKTVAATVVFTAFLLISGLILFAVEKRSRKQRQTL